MKRTWTLLRKLPVRTDGRHDASSKSLGELPDDEVANAFSPMPEILPVDECLLDAWSWTTLSMPAIKDVVPGRPPIEDWLHGISDDDPPQTQVAWRREVRELTDAVLSEQPRPVELSHVLDSYPLKPHELLQARTSRIFDGLKSVVTAADKRAGGRADDRDLRTWIVDRKGAVITDSLRVIADPEAKGNDRKRLEAAMAHKTIVLRDDLGGLDQNGMFDGKLDAKVAHDVADVWSSESGKPLRLRYRTDEQTELIEQQRRKMREVLRVQLRDESDAGEKPAEIVWCVRRRDLDDDSLSFTSQEKQLLGCHLASAETYAIQFARALQLGERETSAVTVAAKFHDLGKRRSLWQRGIGNVDYDPDKLSTCWAKSGTFRPPINRHYRHEFGSLFDVTHHLEWVRSA